MSDNNIFLSVMETQLLIRELEERERQLKAAASPKLYQRRVRKLIDKLYAVKWD